MDRNRLALYSLAHFWVDLSCALLVFRTMAGREDLALCLLLYNFCAFALQMPLGLLADRLDRNGTLAAAGCGVVLLATVHAASVAELSTRPLLRGVLESGVFRRAVVIAGEDRRCRVEALP